MSSNNKSEIDTIYGKKLIVTCVERKYMIVGSDSSFVIIAKKELDEGTTEKLLHEDMELKTFLANYEIHNVNFHDSDNKNVIIEDNEMFKVMKKETPKVESVRSKKTFDVWERKKFVEDKNEESETVKNRRDMIMDTLKRRELLDSLELPEEFTIRDYIEAVEKRGMKLLSKANPYDDFKWFKKVGKVKLVKKTSSGVVIYTMLNKGEGKYEDKGGDKGENDVSHNKGSTDGVVDQDDLGDN